MKNLILLLLVLPIGAQIPLPRPGVITNFSGHGAPGMVSTSKFGDHYIDVDSGTEYACVAVGGRCGAVSSTSWKVAASGDATNLTNIPVANAKSGSLLPLGNLPTADKIRSCRVIIGDPGAVSAVLDDDDDSPVACSNDYGSDWTITTVSCWADAGTPTVTPVLTGGSSTSVLTGALTCGTAAWAAGTVQGTAPVVHSFSGTGATCSSTPCTIDANITTAGGTAKYIVIKIVGTL